MHHYFEALTNTKGDALTGYYARLVDADDGSSVSLYADTSLTPIISVSGVADAAQVDSDGNISFYVAVGTYHMDIYATDSTTLVRRISNIGMNIDIDTAAAAVAAEASASASATSAADSASAAATSATSAAASAVLADGSADIALAAVSGIDVSSSVVPIVSRAALALADTTLPAYLKEAGREGTFVWDSSNLATKVTADTAQGIYVAPASDTTGASGAWVRKYTGFWDIRWFGALADDNANAGTDCLAAINAMLATAAVVARARTGDTSYNGMIGCDFPGNYYCSAVINAKTQIYWRGQGSGMQASYSGSRIRFPTSTAGLVINGPSTTGYTAASVTTTTGADGSIIDGITFWSNGGARPSADATKCGIFLRARATLQNVVVQGFPGHGIMCNASTGGSPYYGNANGFHIRGGAVVNNGCSGLHVQGSDANGSEIVGLDTYGNGYWGKYENSFLGNAYVAGQDAGNGAAAYVCYPAAGQVYFCVVGQETAAATTTPGTDSTVWLPLGAVTGGYPTWVNGTTVNSGGSFYIKLGTHIHPYVEGSQGYAQWGTGAIVIGGLIGAAGTDYISQRIYSSGGQFQLGGGFRSDARSWMQRELFFDGNHSTTAPGSAGLQFGGAVYWNTINGLTYYGYGSTYDVSIFNKNQAAVLSVPTGTQTALFSGAVNSNSATAGVGYGTGAGGTVTQATSKATGVTLNKVSGQITTNNAALASAVKVSFVVTNSAVAATDTIIVSVASGGTANAYRAAVTAVAAGSFTITVENITGGSLSEAPVLNFAVMKAVAA